MTADDEILRTKRAPDDWNAEIPFLDLAKEYAIDPEPLDSGGYGLVYLARARHLNNRHVAIKRLHDNLCGDKTGQLQFIHEAKVLCRLRHHNVVSILNWGRDRQGCFIVMDYVAGQTLENLVSTAGPLSGDRVCRIAEQLCRALCKVHQLTGVNARPVVHGDLHPRNVMISEDDHVTLLDFGVSALHASPSPDNERQVYTRSYASPEQQRGLDLTPQSDLYMLGCTIHFLLTGAAPALRGADQVPRHDAFVPLLQSLLNSSPHRRPPGAAEVASELKSISRQLLLSAGQTQEGGASDTDTLQHGRMPVEQEPISTTARRIPQPTLTPEEHPGTQQRGTTTTDSPGQTTRTARKYLQVTGAVTLAVTFMLCVEFGSTKSQNNAGSIEINITNEAFPGPRPDFSDTDTSSKRKVNVREPRDRGSLIANDNPAPRSTTLMSLDFCRVPSGSFMMGSPEDAGNFDEVLHRVKITHEFWIASTETTQGQWQEVMHTKPWEMYPELPSGANYPAYGMSWQDTQKFLRRLSHLDGIAYRLPTEAEWEYACVGGTDVPSGKVDVAPDGSRAWTLESSNQTIHPVSSHAPNPLGLYDMQGNVQEWCSDWYSAAYYADSPPADPLGPDSPEENNARVVRGGSWNHAAWDARPSSRASFSQFDRSPEIGFRIVTTRPTND